MDVASRDRDVAAIALLDEPVRRRLYDWVIDQAEPVGRDAAAAGVGISRALAAFHLDRLVDGGLLQAAYRRLSGRTGPGAGRPARVYSRAARDVSVNLPDRRYELVAGLFAEALEKSAGPTPTAALAEVAKEAGAELASRQATGNLIETLEATGYEPTIDADGTVRLRNCPFHALVAEHRPLVCGTNLALAEGIVRGAGIDEYAPILDKQPGYCCVSFVRSQA